MKELILITIILIASVSAKSQTLNIDHEKRIEGTVQVSTLTYKARYDNQVFTMKFEEFEDVDPYEKDKVKLIVTIEDYSGEIYILLKDWTKLKLTKGDNGYQFDGFASDLKQILGFQLDNERLIFDRGVETKYIYGDIKRARKQM